ncbi:hypothetical protein GPOL_c32020 [Gordonia polyisoprenivorans VH2]|uniref:Uncharacterized protein n=1 Tax=Gordonia polyisoprenivorans (strain DSM 44266 / VH2) TaxID=1112204 RepID=H6MX99_GORPV|nr:hypothetical protein [Gordonia polyisoprenivorans]AFA74217.1 hypothetical protein GPOL_c32020 [Gordonia polyisoprenivorans VH2]
MPYQPALTERLDAARNGPEFSAAILDLFGALDRPTDPDPDDPQEATP